MGRYFLDILSVCNVAFCRIVFLPLFHVAVCPCFISYVAVFFPSFYLLSLSFFISHGEDCGQRKMIPPSQQRYIIFRGVCSLFVWGDGVHGSYTSNPPTNPSGDNSRYFGNTDTAVVHLLYDPIYL